MALTVFLAVCAHLNLGVRELETSSSANFTKRLMG